MSSSSAGGGWVSAREHPFDDAAAARVALLAAADERIGREAAEAFGVETGAPLHWTLRYPLSAFRRSLASPLGDLAKRTLRRGARELWRRSRPFAAPARVPAGMEVHATPSSPEAGNALLEATTARQLVFLRPGASLLPGALEHVAAAFADAGTTVVYGDSRSRSGVVTRVPRFSPLRLREEDYTGPLVAVSVERIRDAGGFRGGTGSAALLDLLLGVPDREIRAVMTPLAVGDPVDLPTGDAERDAVRVVTERLEEGGSTAVVTAAEGRRRVDYAPPGDGTVSIIIPTRGSSGRVAGAERVLVVEAVRGIVSTTTWPRYELVIVADDSTPQAVVDELEAIAGDRLVLLRWSRPFNFSAKIDHGAAVARGEHLVLLNDDVELLTGDWLERMLGIVTLPGVGMVSGALYFESGAVQHLGHLYRSGGAGHVDFEVMPSPHRRGAMTIVREVAGATGALAMIPAEVFAEVGGLSETFAGNYNDVDLSLKVRGVGLSVVVDGRVALYHFESQTRDATVTRAESVALAGRWELLMREDDYDR